MTYARFSATAALSGLALLSASIKSASVSRQITRGHYPATKHYHKALGGLRMTWTDEEDA